MKKTGKKLALRASVICHLTTLELRDVAAGAGFKESTPGGVCNPDPPPRFVGCLDTNFMKSCWPPPIA